MRGASAVLESKGSEDANSCLNPKACDINTKKDWEKMYLSHDWELEDIDKFANGTLVTMRCRRCKVQRSTSMMYSS